MHSRIEMTQKPMMIIFLSAAYTAAPATTDASIGKPTSRYLHGVGSATPSHPGPKWLNPR